MKLFGYEVTVTKIEDSKQVKKSSDNKDTFDIIQNIIHKNFGNRLEEISTPHSLCLDSLDEMELLMYTENSFSIDINDHDYEFCDTIGDLVKLVDKFLQENKS